ncbi:unnamed protein product [Arabis nemorensis]|uniref:Uncharacterized protein n=1 Tax=Arabis nemorensis TaxID=586526 RepID=A0A565B405_9BRAS|nr:unnamed protein product [Arabis nemorensis]
MPPILRSVIAQTQILQCYQRGGRSIRNFSSPPGTGSSTSATIGGWDIVKWCFSRALSTTVGVGAGYKGG